jgi:hypothetical protein
MAEDLVTWASDQYLGRKWEINQIYKVPGGLPKPLMFSDPRSNEPGEIVFEMNGSYHIWGSDASYGRIEREGPFENVLEYWGRNRIVEWEVTYGDADVRREAAQFRLFYAVCGLIGWND